MTCPNPKCKDKKMVELSVTETLTKKTVTVKFCPKCWGKKPVKRKSS